MSNDKKEKPMIVNLTPHPLHIYPQDTPDRIAVGSVAALRVLPPPAQHHPARLGHQVLSAERAHDGIPVEQVAFGVADGPVSDLPEPRPGTCYVVSLVVGLAAVHRDDLLVLHEYVRDLDGRVIGCRKLARPQRHLPPPSGQADAVPHASSTSRPAKVKPWCNYSAHRTISNRRAAGSRRCKVTHGESKRRANRLIDQWWQQR